MHTFLRHGLHYNIHPLGHATREHWVAAHTHLMLAASIGSLLHEIMVDPVMCSATCEQSAGLRNAHLNTNTKKGNAMNGYRKE